jgi:hypothetical protein
MQGETKIRWEQLCRQASIEDDPETLIALIREINDILEAKQGRLNKQDESRETAS